MTAMLLSAMIVFFIDVDNTIADDVSVPPKVAGDYKPSTCWDFSSDRGRFSSPRYPLSYPNSTECIQTLVAPPGHRVRVDFIGDFDIENSDDCTYDYIELRDGLYGFSTLLGRYCGQRPPGTVKSTGRAMWIAFKTDDSVEYVGFQAAFYFFDAGETSEDSCYVDVDTTKPQGFLSDSDLSAFTFAPEIPVECVWIIHAPIGSRVYIRWKHYEMPAPIACNETYIEIYERTSVLDNRRKLYCGSLARPLQATSNRILMRLWTISPDRMPQFTLVFTVFTHGPCVDDWQFACGDNTCINQSLVCNNYVNCNHMWDEAKCASVTAVGLPMELLQFGAYRVVLVALFCGSMMLAICTLILGCRQRTLARRRRRLRCERKQQQQFKHPQLHDGDNFMMVSSDRRLTMTEESSKLQLRNCAFSSGRNACHCLPRGLRRKSPATAVIRRGRSTESLTVERSFGGPAASVPRLTHSASFNVLQRLQHSTPSPDLVRIPMSDDNGALRVQRWKPITVAGETIFPVQPSAAIFLSVDVDDSLRKQRQKP